MTLSPNDPLIPELRPGQKSRSKIGLLIIALSFLSAVAYVLYSDKKELADITQPLPTQVISDARKPLSILPSSAPESTNTSLTDNKTPEVKSSLPKLPPYDDADNFIKEQLELEQWHSLHLNNKTLPEFNKEHFLQRNIAFLDGLSKGVVLSKVLPFVRPSTTFIADKQGLVLSMGPANFQRYDLFTQHISNIDTQQTAAFFLWTRPLLETAYGELGYPPEKLSTALIEAIDIALATPVINGPISLKRESVLYQYTDPGIEALPGLQKQILRMGPENSATLKQWLSKLRQALMASDNN